MSDSKDNQAAAEEWAVVLQPADVTDGLIDGEELTKRPYPFFVHKRGGIFNHSAAVKAIGFVGDPNRQEVDLWWPDFIRDGDLQKAVGMYLITADRQGRWSTQVVAIEKVSRRERS